MVRLLWAGGGALLASGGALLAWKLLTAERTVALEAHHAGLRATAELKSEAIVHWQLERMGDIRLLALSPRVAHPVQAIQRADHPVKHRLALQAELDRLRTVCADCKVLTVFDYKGRFLAASAGAGATGPPAPSLVEAPPHTGFQRDLVTRHIKLLLAAPILDDDDGMEQSYGQLVAEVDPAVHLFPLLQAWPSSSGTGELELVERQGGEVEVLVLSRNRPEFSRSVRIPLAQSRSAAVLAATGSIGVVEAVDYSGTPVLAVGRPVGDTRWTLVVKEDLAEVLAPYWERVRLYGVALAGLLLAILGLLAFFSQQRRILTVRRERSALALELDERRRHNLELARAELRFRSLVLASSQMVWTTNANGEVVEPLPSWQAFTGMTAEEIRGFGWLAAIHPEDTARADRAWRQAVTARTSYTIQYRVRRHDGQFGTFEAQGVPLMGPDGQVVEWIGTCTDITQRVEAEEALRAGELWQRRLIENLGVGVVVHSADTSIVSSNPEACRVLGLTEAQLRGRVAIDPGWRFLREDGIALPLEDYPVNRVLATRQSFRGETFGVDRADGTPPRWVLVNAYPSQDARGRLENVVVSFSDITDQRRAEAEAARLAEHLRVSQKIEALGRLAGGVAHDFNNILSVILGHAAFALEQVAATDPVREDLVEVEQAGRRAAALTRQLLAFGRRQVLQPRPLDLNQVVVELEKMLRRLIGEDVRLEKSLADGLWKTLADPAQVEQVIMNLVINARDAMAGGGRLTIVTANLAIDPEQSQEEAPGDYVVLEVTDTGTGIDPATRVRLFEPFFTTKPQGKGTGLGLSTVYGIVTQSGGQVQVESQPGQGSTFRVLLPRAPQAEAGEAAGPTAPVAVARGGETILVVEDEEPVRNVTRRILVAAGYRVLDAESGPAALRHCQEHPGEIHLLLTDVVMPRMGGPECALAAQRLRPGLRLLFMSGYADDAIAHHGVLQSGVPLLGKPFSGAELTRQVREVLEAPAPAPLAAERLPVPLS